MHFPVTLTSIFFSIGIILLGCLIMARYKDIFEKVKIPFAIITFIGGLTVYTMGYMPIELVNGDAAHKAIEYGSVIFRALFSTCRAFILESDFNDVRPHLQTNSLYILTFSIVHIMALMLTVLTVLSFFGMKFIARLQLLMANNQEVYVFCGLNEASYYLMKDIRKNGKNRTIVVIENFPDKDEDGNTLLKKIRENHCILIDYNPYEIQSLKKLGLSARLFKKRIHLFILSENQNHNAKVALSMMRSIKKDRLPEEGVTLYIQSASEGIELVLERANQENNSHIEFKVFNIPDITARQLIETYPIYDTLELDTENAVVRSDFTMLVAGFSKEGEEILRKGIYSGQFIGGCFKAFVVDSKKKMKIGTFHNRYSGIKPNYDIDFLEAEPGSQAFFNLLYQHGHILNYIAISLGDDKINMDMALEIQRLVNRGCINKNATIAVHIGMPEEYAHYENVIDLPNIHFFGRIPDIFTESIIINESMDKMARKMNTMFNQIYHIEPADNWNMLDAFTKESNRSASMNIRTKLKLLGLDMAEKGKAGEHVVDLKKYLIDQKLENLAKQEHLRWNAFHFASGWTTWELSETGDAKKAKDLKNKRHACLVSWEGLKKVTAHFKQNPSYEELDFQQVRHIPDILEFAGYEVFRTN